MIPIEQVPAFIAIWVTTLSLFCVAGFAGNLGWRKGKFPIIVFAFLFLLGYASLFILMPKVR